MLRCLVIDDEQPAIDVLEKYIHKVGVLNLVGSTTDPVDGIRMIAEKYIEVAFVDIEMPGLSGIHVKKMIDPKVQVIFCTAHSEFAVESYDLNIVDYLLKPVSFDRFEKAVSRLGFSSKAGREVKNDYIFVATDHKRKLVRINIEDIDFIEARGNYVAIFTLNRPLLVYSSLKDMEVYLYDSNFIRVHKSYLVSESKIQIIEPATILLNGCDRKIPIGKEYKEQLLERLKKKMFSK